MPHLVPEGLAIMRDQVDDQSAASRSQHSRHLADSGQGLLLVIQHEHGHMLKGTHERALEIVPIELLKEFAADLN